MGDNIDIDFFIKPRCCDEKLVRRLVNTVIEIGSTYNQGLGYWSDKDDRGPFGDRSLDEAIEIVARDEGAIYFWYKNIDYSLGIRPSKYHSKTVKAGQIGVRVDSVYFRQRESGGHRTEKESTNNAQALMELAEAVLKGLEPKPIYGIGDDSDYVLYRPSDDEILALREGPLYWLNFYGPDLIKRFGREKLLSAPAHRVEELGDVILLSTGKVPEIYSTDFGRTSDIKRKVSTHLFGGN